MRRYNKNFRFADEIVSGDAIISAILGIISIIATLITVIYVVSVKGMTCVCHTHYKSKCRFFQKPESRINDKYNRGITYSRNMGMQNILTSLV